MDRPEPGPAGQLTRANLLAGASACMPRAGGVIVYGIAMGVAADAAGLSLPEALLFSGLVNAGAAQFAALQIWTADVALLTMALAVATMNARYLLLGAALRPLYVGLPPAFSYGSLFVLYDNNWALAIQEDREGSRPIAFFLGAGMLLWSIWMVGTTTGHIFGQLLGDARRYGLDFTLLAFFSVLAATFARHMKDAIPVVAAIAVAVGSHFAGIGPWYILAGAIAGCTVAALRHSDEAARP
ncbi:MAG: hypothetical protein RLZ98_1368 [Pseudomonadota bacterium]|jgi:predicted branched-subunit amino acid permease